MIDLTSYFNIHFEPVDYVSLGLACVAGGVIGLERELNDKPAGLRTNIFICFGAALFTIMSANMADTFGADKTRIAAQIVSGVGFLGAGSIIQAGRGVRGLTTAATIWTNASIGVALGGGYHTLGLISASLVLLILWVFQYIERLLARFFDTSRIEIRTDQGLEAAEGLRQLMEVPRVSVRRFRIEKRSSSLEVFAMLVGPEKRIERVMHNLLADSRVSSLKYLG